MSELKKYNPSGSTIRPGEMVESKDGEWLRIQDLPDTMVPVYSAGPSGMHKNQDGAWVHLTDHNAHLAAMDIRYAREDENAVQGFKLANMTHDPARENPHRRHAFNSTVGPYLHLDMNGSWVPWATLQEVLADTVHATSNRERLLRKELQRFRDNDNRELDRTRTKADRDRADKRLLVMDLKVLLDWNENLQDSDEGRDPSVLEGERAIRAVVKFIREIDPEFRREEYEGDGLDD